DDAQRFRPRVRAEDAADLADDQFLAGELFAKTGGDRLGLVGRLRVHHSNVLNGKLAPEVLDHALDRTRPRPHTIDRLDLAVGYEQQRLEVEHGPDHGFRPASTAAPSRAA